MIFLTLTISIDKKSVKAILILYQTQLSLTTKINQNYLDRETSFIVQINKRKRPTSDLMTAVRLDSAFNLEF